MFFKTAPPPPPPPPPSPPLSFIQQKRMEIENAGTFPFSLPKMSRSQPSSPRENHGFFCSSASSASSSSSSSGSPSFCKPSKSKSIKISQADVVCSAILRLYQTRKHSDVVFVVGTDRMTFPAHQLILAAHSPVFESLFFDENDTVFPTSPKFPYKDQQRRPMTTSLTPTSSPPSLCSSGGDLSQMTECLLASTSSKMPVDKYNITAARSASPVMSKAKTIRLGDVESDVFAAFLQYLYSGEVFIDTALATPLFGLASNFQVKSLKQKCGEYVASNISAETVVRFLEDSVGHDLPTLYDKCFQFILENFVDVVRTTQFREDFSEAQLKKILQSSEINASELCVFSGLVRWGICQVEMRPAEFEQVRLQQVLSNLLKHVRWDLMTPEEIVDVVRPIGIAPVEELFEALASRHSTQNGPPVNARKGSFLPTSEEVIESLQAELQKLPQLDLPQPSSSNSAGEPPLPNNVYSPPRTATLNIEKRVQNHFDRKTHPSLSPTIESESSHLYTDETMERERTFHSPETKREKKRTEKQRQMKDVGGQDFPSLSGASTCSSKSPMPGALNQSHKSSSWASNRKRSDSAEGITNQWDQEVKDQISLEHPSFSPPPTTNSLSSHGILPSLAALPGDDTIEEELPSRKSPRGKKKKKESRQKKTYSNEGVSFGKLSPDPPNHSRPPEGKKKRRGSQGTDRDKNRLSRKRTSNFNSP